MSVAKNGSMGFLESAETHLVQIKTCSCMPHMYSVGEYIRPPPYVRDFGRRTGVLALRTLFPGKRSCSVEKTINGLPGIHLLNIDPDQRLLPGAGTTSIPDNPKGSPVSPRYNKMTPCSEMGGTDPAFGQILDLPASKGAQPEGWRGRPRLRLHPRCSGQGCRWMFVSQTDGHRNLHTDKVSKARNRKGRISLRDRR